MSRNAVGLSIKHGDTTFSESTNAPVIRRGVFCVCNCLFLFTNVQMVGSAFPGSQNTDHLTAYSPYTFSSMPPTTPPSTSSISILILREFRKFDFYKKQSEL